MPRGRQELGSLPMPCLRKSGLLVLTRHDRASQNCLLPDSSAPDTPRQLEPSARSLAGPTASCFVTHEPHSLRDLPDAANQRPAAPFTHATGTAAAPPAALAPPSAGALPLR